MESKSKKKEVTNTGYKKLLNGKVYSATTLMQIKQDIQIPLTT